MTNTRSLQLFCYFFTWSNILKSNKLLLLLFLIRTCNFLCISNESRQYMTAKIVLHFVKKIKVCFFTMVVVHFFFYVYPEKTTTWQILMVNWQKYIKAKLYQQKLLIFHQHNGWKEAGETNVSPRSATKTKLAICPKQCHLLEWDPWIVNVTEWDAWMSWNVKVPSGILSIQFIQSFGNETKNSALSGQVHDINSYC